MIYSYACQTCENQWDEVRPVDNRDEPCLCICGESAKRIFTPSRNLNAGACAFKQDHYTAFNKAFSTKRELMSEIDRIKHTTGKEIVEVGNDSMKSLKPDVPTKLPENVKKEATKELAYRMKHG